MLLIKSKYKLAKRLGAHLFEKTQTQKFALSEARSAKSRRGGRAPSDYGRQLLEKQKVRYTYGLTEGQLARYAEKAYEAKNPGEALHRALESRVDNVMYRAGFAPTRRAARQMVSHGHIKVNGTRVTVPSHQLKKDDVCVVRDGSRTKTLFAKLNDPEGPTPSVPKWMEVDAGLMQVKVVGAPAYIPSDVALEYASVFEFYSR